MSTFEIRLTVSTEQELFDAVVRHLATMSGRCANEDDNCLYRREDGNRCAIGAVVPDDQYHPGMERQGADALAGHGVRLKNGELVRIVTDISPAFLNGIQWLHDDWNNWKSGGKFTGWGMVAEFAIDNGLDCTVLDEVWS